MVPMVRARHGPKVDMVAPNLWAPFGAQEAVCSVTEQTQTPKDEPVRGSLQGSY